MASRPQIAAIVTTASMTFRVAAAVCVPNFEISAGTGRRFPDVAYNSVNGNYLAVYTNYASSPPRIAGRENRSQIAYDPGNSHWLVRYSQINPGFSFDQYGQFVGTDSSRIGGSKPIAAPGSQLVRLAWTNPANPQYSGTLIRYKTSGFPTGPADGDVDQSDLGDFIDCVGGPNRPPRY